MRLSSPISQTPLHGLLLHSRYRLSFEVREGSTIINAEGAETLATYDAQGADTRTPAISHHAHQSHIKHSGPFSTVTVSGHVPTLA